MRRLLLACLLPGLLAASSCTGATGYNLLSFYAVAVGPPDAKAGQPYAFTSDGGFQVQLTKAVMHVGAIYLDDSRTTAGGGEGKCTLPGTYVGEVLPIDGLDVDMLSPQEQLFPITGIGSNVPAAVAQVWLSGPDVYDPADTTIVLSIAGTATSPAGKAFPFSGDVTINQQRFPMPVGTALPGSNPVCVQRIVTPILVDLTLAQSGTLILHLDPAALFTNVDFSSLKSFGDGYGFTNDATNQASINLFSNLQAPGPVYRFEFRAAAP